MARINVVVPKVSRKTFTGGIWCVMRHARGLAERGHQVCVVPSVPSPAPEWFPPAPNLRVLAERGGRVGRLARAAVASKEDGNPGGGRGERLLLALAWELRGSLPHEVRRAVSVRYAGTRLPDADATLATSFETALPVRLYGRGAKLYFMQHFEPYFAAGHSGGALALEEARMSYRLGLRMIANSSWLQGMVQREVPGAPVALCPNAIDHRRFFGSPKTHPGGDEIRVISYGGRDVRWKGFEEMAQAMRIARERCAPVRLQWLVYGGALLPPDNPVAPYTSLGFLPHDKLGDAYREADVLLSASWYESFPLFPLEAMACGLPVVTTQAGTEEFAFPGKTAEVVEARDPERIAEGLARLVRDPAHYDAVARAGQEISLGFTWDRAVGAMEEIVMAAIEEERAVGEGSGASPKEGP